jgi:hypothetical protein
VSRALLSAFDAVRLVGTVPVRDEAVAAGVPSPAAVREGTAFLAFAGTEGAAEENPDSYRCSRRHCTFIAG